MIFCKRRHVGLGALFILFSFSIPVIIIYKPPYEHARDEWRWSTIFWRLTHVNTTATNVIYTWRRVYPVTPDLPGNNYHEQNCCHEYVIAWNLPETRTYTCAIGEPDCIVYMFADDFGKDLDMRYRKDNVTVWMWENDFWVMLHPTFLPLVLVPVLGLIAVYSLLCLCGVLEPKLIKWVTFYDKASDLPLVRARFGGIYHIATQS